MAEAAAPSEHDDMLTTMLALAAADNEKENEHAGEADPRAKSAGKRTRDENERQDGLQEEADQAQKRPRTEPPTPVPYIGEPAAARPVGVAGVAPEPPAPNPAEHEKPTTLSAPIRETEAAATEAANKPAEAANKPAARRARRVPRPTSRPPLPAAPKPAAAKNDKTASEPALQSFPCPVEGCTYVAHRRSHLAQHRQRHSDARPFVCTYPGCSYAAKRAVTLIEHKRTHTGEKPYSCTVPGCTYKAAQRTTLRSHIQRRHSNRPKPPPRKDANAAKLMILLEQTTDADSPTKVDRAKQAKLQGKAKSKGKAKAPSSTWPMSGAGSGLMSGTL